MKMLLILLVLMASACGMQGDLYLPGDEAKDSSSKINSTNIIQKT